MPEKFDPKQFNSYEELPEKQKPQFKPVESGFVGKDAIENPEKAQEEAKMDVDEISTPKNIKLESKEKFEINLKEWLNYDNPHKKEYRELIKKSEEFSEGWDMESTNNEYGMKLILQIMLDIGRMWDKSKKIYSKIG